MDTEGPDKPAKGRSGKDGARAIVAAALAAGKTIKDAAATAGVHERTVRKWLACPYFCNQVEQLRDEAVKAAMNRLSTEMTQASGVLVGLLRSRDQRVKLRAAKIVIEVGMKLRDHADLEQRVKDLEAKLAGGAR